MRVLLDTHTLYWWLADRPELSAPARKLISRTGNTILVSAASTWEIAIKARLGKLPIPLNFVGDLEGLLSLEGFEPLAISVEHSVRAGLLPGPHQDPFDRMLVAQAQAENIPIVSKDVVFDAYGVRRLW